LGGVGQRRLLRAGEGGMGWEGIGFPWRGGRLGEQQAAGINAASF
jgi:hypothetical protein